MATRHDPDVNKFMKRFWLILAMNREAFGQIPEVPKLLKFGSKTLIVSEGLAYFVKCIACKTLVKHEHFTSWRIRVSSKRLLSRTDKS